jgi:hypothetical protein
MYISDCRMYIKIRKFNQLTLYVRDWEESTGSQFRWQNILTQLTNTSVLPEYVLDTTGLVQSYATAM